MRHQSDYRGSYLNIVMNLLPYFHQFFLASIGLNHSIIVVCVILLVIDFFIPSDIPTFLSYLLLSFLVFWNLDVDFLYRLLFSIIAFFIFIAFHFTVWAKIVQSFVNKYISPTKHHDGPQALVGLVGKTVLIEGDWYVRIDGDIWRCHKIENISDGMMVQVTEFTDGMLKIRNI